METLASSRPAFIFDYDGTLSPIVHRAELANMRVSTRDAQSRLARIAPCSIVTGRARADMLSRIDPSIGLTHVCGNHGSEWGSDEDPRHIIAVAEWYEYLRGQLAHLSGIEIENKKLSLSLHYRMSSDHEFAREEIVRVFAGLAKHGLRPRIVRGKLVFNLVPLDAPHKGDAVRRIARELSASHVYFIGDDVTDEDAFALGAQNDLGFEFNSIRIGYCESSRAQFFIESQVAIDAWIESAFNLLSRSR